jgi:hypothetical protein
MFVQVIEGRAKDAQRIHEALDRWERELSDGAIGWLGSTEGVTDDGRFMAVVRFESEAAARRNSERPEQDKWWREEMSKLLDGPANFYETSDVDADINGDPDQATFVQIMRGRTSDPDRVRELMAEDSDEWAKFRPEVLGSISAQYDDGSYTMAMYFTSESDARKGEKKKMPPKLKAEMDEMNSLVIGETEFIDIHDPWLHSPHE